MPARPAKEPPAGSSRIHEIKHDGFRILGRRAADRVRLVTRNGYDFTARYPKIVAAPDSLPVRSCVVDGEAIIVDERGLAIFDALRYRLLDHAAVRCTFDLIELNGKDLRWHPLEDRKAALADLFAASPTASPLISTSAATARASSSTPARSAAKASSRSVWGRIIGRVEHWLKIKNPEAPAVPAPIFLALTPVPKSGRVRASAPKSDAHRC